jgi:RNA polymerase sigma factor (sigma-70 family)
MDCYRATFGEVYRYAAMLCGGDQAAAEDLVQDVYLVALDKARRNTLSIVSVGYLVVAARHRFLDRLRSQQREQRRLQLVASTPAPDPVSLAMPARLADLPERERTAVILRYVDDLTVAQAAAELGISTRAAESLLARAMHRLRANGAQEVRDA